MAQGVGNGMWRLAPRDQGPGVSVPAEDFGGPVSLPCSTVGFLYNLKSSVDQQHAQKNLSS